MRILTVIGWILGIDAPLWLRRFCIVPFVALAIQAAWRHDLGWSIAFGVLAVANAAYHWRVKP